MGENAEKIETGATERAYVGVAAQRVSTAEAARLIGVSATWLRQCCLGQRGPIMPHDDRDGTCYVQPGAAYDHIRAHAKRQPPNLRTPPDYNSENSAEKNAFPPATTSANAQFADPTDALIQLALGSKEPRTLALASAADARRRKMEAAAGKMIHRDEVRKGYRALGELWIRLIEDGAAPLVDSLLSMLRREGVINEHPRSRELMIQEVMDSFGNGTIKRVREFVEDQAKGVEHLDGTK